MATRSGVEVRVKVNNLPRIRRAFPAFVRAAIGKATVEAQHLTAAKAPVDTGNLKNSYSHTMEVSVGGRITGIVFTPVEYAPYVEFGTRNMAARPHAVPAHEIVGKALLAALSNMERGL